MQMIGPRTWNQGAKNPELKVSTPDEHYFGWTNKSPSERSPIKRRKTRDGSFRRLTKRMHSAQSFALTMWSLNGGSPEQKWQIPILQSCAGTSWSRSERNQEAKGTSPSEPYQLAKMTTQDAQTFAKKLRSQSSQNCAPTVTNLDAGSLGRTWQSPSAPNSLQTATIQDEHSLAATLKLLIERDP